MLLFGFNALLLGATWIYLARAGTTRPPTAAFPFAFPNRKTACYAAARDISGVQFSRNSPS